MKTITLYHGTTEANAHKIMQEGFKPDTKHNWDIKGKQGFVYLSLAYAPFYAMAAKGKGNLAIIKVEVPLRKLYPEDDFVMFALRKPVYTQADLDKLNLETCKSLAKASLKHMGNAAAKPEDIKIVGCRIFDGTRLLYRCDPCITPINYLIMGQYYNELSEWIYQGNKPEDFKHFMSDAKELTA